MKEKVIESSVLFISIMKWLFFASCAGVLVGLSTAAFLKLLGMGVDMAGRLQFYYLLLPAALFLSALIVRYLAPDAEGHGTEKVIEAVHKHSGKINPLVVPVKLLATIITIAFGGSAGKEGPAAQIGAAVTSTVSSLLKLTDHDRKKLVICGISAGFAAVFGTPIAGAIFGVEVLFVGGLMYEVLFPSFVAGIVGYEVSSSLGITYFHKPLRFVPVFSSMFFIKVCIAGIFFGLCALLMIEVLRLFEQMSHRLKLWAPVKGLVGGSVLAALAFIFSARYLGLGLNSIRESLEGATLPRGAFFLKMVFTAITLGFGGSGGIITPIFFVGAAAGNAFAGVLGYDASVFSAIGMIALLAGAANTPISASIMAIELFGSEMGPYAAVACVISFLMTGHRSVYPSQVLSLTKSSSLVVEQGRQMRDIESIGYHPRSKSLSDLIVRGFRRITKK